VNIAARVEGLAGASEIYVSWDARHYPGVDEILAECEIVPEQANVKGVSEKLDVYKITVSKQTDVDNNSKSRAQKYYDKLFGKWKPRS
jgi:class 3 adenylate cyclase